jgi:hypothetical protein
MTFSDAWLESPEDPEFEDFLKQTKGLRVLPTPHLSNNYWINHLKQWAKKEQLPIQYPDYLEIRVSVSKAQLLRFMDDMFHAGEPISILRDYIAKKCNDQVSYIIVADEF